MKRLLVVGAVLLLCGGAAEAQERAGDAALGALSGAVILGPVGAVAGAVVGYTAGPSIARSWGLRRGSPHAKRRPARPAKGLAGRAAAPARQARGELAASTARPAPRSPGAAATPTLARPATPMPAVQGFE